MARETKRITRVTTKSGDRGSTSLADGSRVPKTHARIRAIGAVDEVNSFVGLLLTEIDKATPLAAPCARVQQELFDIGAYLATLGATPCPDPLWLEAEVTRLNEQLPPLKEFVIPGGTRAAALAHVCRATCRRAERDLWELGEETADAARYANRLSDLFFVMARICNAGDEPQWRGLPR